MPGEMELEIEVEELLKGFTRDLAYGTLTDVGEHGVQKFAKHGRSDAGGAVCGERKVGYVRDVATHSRG